MALLALALPLWLGACQDYGDRSPDVAGTADGRRDGDGDSPGDGEQLDGDDGAPPADACDVDGCAGDTGPSIYPECEARGGACTWVGQHSDRCPAGSYCPFSGQLRACLVDSIQICCVPRGGLGSPCTLDQPCDSGGCLPETSGYPPGGFCPALCEPGAEPPGCPDWAICLPVYFSAAAGVCLPRCDQDPRCRPGWSCQALPLQPFAEQPATRYACWDPPAGVQGLGRPCRDHGDCLSHYCLADDSGMGTCSASCSAERPCLPGYSCRQLGGRRGCLPG
jgi:hypothetical protein